MTGMAARRFQSSSDGSISEEARDAFHADGFLVLDGFASPEEIAALNQEIDAILAEAEAPGSPTVFGDHAADRYFLESGDKVRFFFEPDGVDDEGRPVRRFDEALNKIGHNLHDLNPAFERFFRQSKFQNLATSLGVPTSVLVQSMVIFKQPGIGAPVGWHQDATFLRTEPHSVIGFWMALEDADKDNGCLYAVPGSHKTSLRKWFGRIGPDNLSLEMRELDPAPFETDGAVPLEAPAGTLVLLHGFLPHMSTANKSSRSRRALTLHTVDGQLPYPKDNWLQRPSDAPALDFFAMAQGGEGSQ